MIHIARLLGLVPAAILPATPGVLGSVERCPRDCD